MTTLRIVTVMLGATATGCSGTHVALALGLATVTTLTVIGMKAHEEHKEET